MWGLQPGPLLFSTDPGFAWGCIASLFLANGIAVVCAFSMMPLMTRVITISNKILIPTITVVCAVGSFSATESMYGLYIMFFSGIACYLLDRDGYPMAPLLLSFVLTPLFEKYMRRAFSASAGHVEIFWQSAICKTCLALFVFFLVAPMVKTAVMKRRAARKQSGGNA